jgi:hypothetical protein
VGNSVETCSANGTWGTASACTNQTCSAGTCQGVCAPGQTNCNGNTPQTCGAAGAWVNGSPCAQPSPFCVGGACTCNETLCGGTTCTNLNTTSNCSACGDACNETNASADSCNGTTCSYTCNAGASDCNAGTHPDTDGCECATPGCCSGGLCQTTHTDGIGQNYFDCNPLHTYSVSQATEACTAYAATQTGGSGANCSDGWTCGTGGNSANGDSVCYGNTAGTTCTKFCWVVIGGESYTSPTPPGTTPPAGSVTSCTDCILSSGNWN